jgi:capsular exopolysaccharide synthesis family protein
MQIFKSLFRNDSANDVEIEGPLVMDWMFDNFLKIAIDLQREYHHVDGSAVTVAFTSSRPGEGTTTIVSNVAIAVAGNFDSRILLVDASIRGQGATQFLGFPEGNPGFFDLILEDADLDDVLLRDETRNLYVLPAGNVPQHPVACLERDSFVDLIYDIKGRFDLVFFDAPPVVISPVTPVLAASLDTTILVVEAEKTRWEVAKHARNTLEEAGVQLAGAFLNKKQMFIPDFIYKYIL